MMHPPLLSIAYAPPIQYFVKLYEADGSKVYIEAHENYVKQSYRNRCIILCPNGSQTLTIPVEHLRDQKQSIRDVKISQHKDWQHQHLHAISTAYGASPYFEYYWDDIQSLISQPHKWLWELNWVLMHQLVQMLDLSVQLIPTSSFQPPALEYPKDWRYKIRPRKTEPDDLFKPIPYYQQRYDRLGFIGNLSILDLLFNMGPEAILILKACSKL